MKYIQNNDLEQLLNSCKSELLSHVLQDQVASDHIKNINKYLDRCLNILDGNTLRDSIHSRGARIKGSSKDIALFFAYCMSRFDYPFVESLAGEKLNQTEAFVFLESQLGVKAATLRNYRDLFDPHVEQTRSERQGWKKEINSKFQSIIDQYDSETEEELLNEARIKLGLKSNG